GHLPPELDQPLDGLAPDIRVGRVRGRLLARGPALAGALRSPRARDLLALARLDGSRVEQAVLAVDRLQTATGKQGPHGPGGGKGLGQAEIPADVRRRDLEQLTGGHPGGHGGEKRVRPLQALLVHRLLSSQFAVAGATRYTPADAPAARFDWRPRLGVQTNLEPLGPSGSGGSTVASASGALRCPTIQAGPPATPRRPTMDRCLAFASLTSRACSPDHSRR